MLLEDLKNYAISQNSSKEILEWIDRVGKPLAELDNHEGEQIVDYLARASSAPKRLRKMSVEQAKKASRLWHKSQTKKGKNIKEVEGKDYEVVLHHGEFTVVRLLTKEAYQREGHMMAHCVGAYDVKEGVDIYSLRDKNNMAHATLEIFKNEGVNQIKGKGNGGIHPRYIYAVLEFLRFIGNPVRLDEMANLGFYHIDKNTLELVKGVVQEDGTHPELTFIEGEHYVRGPVQLIE